MIKRKVSLWSIVFVIGMVTLAKSLCKPEPESDLLLRNIDALSAGEEPFRVCYGSGNVDCNGIKVREVIEYYNLYKDK